MNTKIEQLPNLIVSSKTLSFADEDVSNVLLGKYLVLKNTVNEDSICREGDLFIIHEKFFIDSSSLNDYLWEEGGKFDYEGMPVILKDQNSSLETNIKEIKEKLSDNMANVIDNKVCFSMQFSDYGYDFELLKNENHVIGFKVAGIGSWINTPQVKLKKACTQGNLEEVKKLLTSSIIKEKAKIDYESFSSACHNNHKEIIKFLLSSSELEEHVLINDKEDDRFKMIFIALCHSNTEMVKELINELPENVFEDIKYLIKDTNNVKKNKEELIQVLDLRETKNNINKFKP